MPLVPPGGTVLVTGSAGFYGAWVVRAFLEAGYIVRGQVDSESTGEHLRGLFNRFGSSFETVVVEDPIQVCPLLLRIYSLRNPSYSSERCLRLLPRKS